MKCPKCGIDNFEVISKTSGKIKRRGLLSILFHIIMMCMTAGLWIIIPLISGGSKGKIKTQTIFVCKNCGNEFTQKQVK